MTVRPDRRGVPVWSGHPYPLGASFDGTGTNFALFSEVAERVDLVLVDDHGAHSSVPLTEVDGFVWHGHLPGVGPGQRYGYRVHGPWDPAAGHRCDPAKLLLDPYTRAVDGRTDNDPSLYEPGADSAGHTMLGVVTDPFFDWGTTVRPSGRTPTPSSTRHTSAASPAPTPRSPPNCAAPTPGWPIPPSSSTSPRWA